MIEIENFPPWEDALEFRKQYDSFQEAWQNCPRGDWMLWIAGSRLDVDLQTLTCAKVRCASTVQHLMKDPRSLAALDIALKFSNGDVTREEFNEVEGSAADAARYACAAFYTDPTNENTAARYAAETAAATVAAPRYAYLVAVAAEKAEYAAYARKHAQKLMADICRDVLTDVVFKKLEI